MLDEFWNLTKDKQESFLRITEPDVVSDDHSTGPSRDVGYRTGGPRTSRTRTVEVGGETLSLEEGEGEVVLIKMSRD